MVAIKKTSNIYYTLRTIAFKTLFAKRNLYLNLSIYGCFNY
jgi:hypothetical protein